MYLLEALLAAATSDAVFSAALALLACKQIKQGWRFYFSKRRLIAKLREKKL